MITVERSTTFLSPLVQGESSLPCCHNYKHCLMTIFCVRPDTSGDEMDDLDVQQIIIVTQTSPAFRKHPGGDRTGQSYNRSKLTADIAQAINDALYFYEQVC